MQLVEPLFSDFCRFAQAHVESDDVEDMLPLLRRFYELEGLTPERALWRTVLYGCWLHVASAETVWRAYPTPGVLAIALAVPEVRADLEKWRLPTAIERRGMRRISEAWRHLEALLRVSGGDLVAWVEEAVGEGGVEGWRQVRRVYEALPQCGPFSSYKWADLLQEVHGYPIEAPDIGVGGGGEDVGPLPGMMRLTGETWQRCARDVELQRDLLKACQDRGVPFKGLNRLETSLCDFNSLCRGNYYVGHDIDVQQEELLKAQSLKLWQARREVFQPRYLGEVGGWVGVRRHLNVVYRDTGEVLT